MAKSRIPSSRLRRQCRTNITARCSEHQSPRSPCASSDILGWPTIPRPRHRCIIHLRHTSARLVDHTRIPDLPRPPSEHRKLGQEPRSSSLLRFQALAAPSDSSPRTRQLSSSVAILKPSTPEHSTKTLKWTKHRSSPGINCGTNTIQLKCPPEGKRGWI